MFTVWQVEGLQRSMRSTTRPQDYNRNDVDKHCDENGDEDDDHHGTVETNTGKSYRANFYLAPFDNTTIRYAVAAMV